MARRPFCGLEESRFFGKPGFLVYKGWAPVVK